VPWDHKKFLFQTAIAKTVMEIVFTKLGLIAPEKAVPAKIKNAFQLLWANNGDAISRQYAGTNALKVLIYFYTLLVWLKISIFQGDYTRTGERKFSGLMKDSVNSASRYYQGRFRDAERQAVIDIMLGETNKFNIRINMIFLFFIQAIQFLKTYFLVETLAHLPKTSLRLLNKSSMW
jgi:hypothetical protein